MASENKLLLDLVEWVVNAGSLQVGSDVIQESVILFRVGQRWILVVSFNVCQQRPGKVTITDDIQRIKKRA